MPISTTAKLALAILFSCPGAIGQSQKDPAPTTSVTVTGCIHKGVECLTLKDSTGKQDYSIAATPKLQVGRAYRITGPVSTMGMCQEGKPILEAHKISKSKLKCEAPPAP
jgi:hypothetical protein